MGKFSYIFLISLLLSFTTACGSQRTAVRPQTPQTSTMQDAGRLSQGNMANDVASTFGDWKTLKAGGSVSLKGGTSFSASMQMRMIKGRSIYISVRPLGLVEVAKLIVTGDTLIVVDKLHKKYLCENVKLFLNGIPADVSTVQDIFLGRAFVLGEGTLSQANLDKVEATAANGVNVIKPLAQYKGFNYAFTFDSALKILSVEVKPVSGHGSTYVVNYGDVQYTPAGQVAGTIEVSTKLNGKNFTFKLDYGNFTWNEGVKIDTALPKRYTRVDGSRLLNLLSQ